MTGRQLRPLVELPRIPPQLRQQARKTDPRIIPDSLDERVTHGADLQSIDIYVRGCTRVTRTGPADHLRGCHLQVFEFGRDVGAHYAAVGVVEVNEVHYRAGVAGLDEKGQFFGGMEAGRGRTSKRAVKRHAGGKGLTKRSWMVSSMSTP